jgi:hypothetical protein
MARRAALLLMAVAASGCAINPVVDWNPPLEEKRSGVVPLDTMEGARAYAAAYKQAVHAKARDYAGAQGQLDDTLLFLGVLTVGSLVGKAHRDVPTVLAGLFGATYLSGQQNLGKPRLDVYQSGIGATNCAVAAVAPLNFSTSELSQLARESDALGKRDLPTLAWWLSAARMTFATSNITDASQKSAINSQLDAAAASYQAGLTLLNDTSQLPGRVSAAASGLKGMVDTISAQVDKLASNTIVDPASIPRSLSLLAGIAGSVAPGAGLDTTFTSRINPSSTTTAATNTNNTKLMVNPQFLGSLIRDLGEKPAEAPRPDGAANLSDALANLAAAQARVESKVKYLGGRIAASKVTATEVLRQCGVPDALLAMSIDHPSVPIVIKSSASDAVTQEVTVRGGATNFTARFTKAGGGVDVAPPRAGERTLVIKVPKDAAKGGDLDLVLTVEDSSNPPQRLEAPVKIQKP